MVFYSAANQLYGSLSWYWQHVKALVVMLKLVAVKIKIGQKVLRTQIDSCLLPPPLRIFEDI